MDDSESRLVQQRKEKLALFKKKGINPYPSVFHKTHSAGDILDTYAHLKKEEKTKTNVVIAGRVMTLRVMGKAGFAHVQDSSGKIQIYAREDDLKKDYELFSHLDLGDIIGVEGIVFCTKTGEISLWVHTLTLLAKNLRPLPEKWHGLKDTELRYRQRYVDLIVNSEVRDIFLKRNKIVHALKSFLVQQGFIEVETPILQPLYGGTNARPFKSYLHNLKMDVYLRVSNELYLKRLIVGGYEKIFEFSPDFRNEGIDTTHNPEFLQMETMWAYANYNDNMDLCENMIRFIAQHILDNKKITLGEHVIDFGKKFTRLSMVDALKKYGKIDTLSLSLADLKKELKKNKVDHEKDISWGIAIALLFEHFVEKQLVQPTFIYDYPVETSPLAKVYEKDERFVERFELYINGWEIANSYSELNDPEILQKNWEAQEKKARGGDEEAQRMDYDFLHALEVGMPPTSGLGIGVDRLVMILTGSLSIKEVIFFPFMKK